MFFIFGITQKDNKLEYNHKLFIHDCNKYGHIEVFMTYMTLSIFFIPTFRWNKKYYAKYTCCGDIYEIKPEIGNKIKQGENIELKSEDFISLSYKDTSKKCINCGNIWSEFYDYCPKCGNKL